MKQSNTVLRTTLQRRLDPRAGISRPLDNSPPPAKLKVVLLHGLWRGPGSMRSLARKLEKLTGYQTFCIPYPSASRPLAELAALTNERIRAEAGDEGPFFAVTHSMGGIVLRHIQSQSDGVEWQGACMLAPPNNGSKTARTLCMQPVIGPLFQQMLGPAAVELGDVNLANKWPLPPKPCGIISATVSLSVFNPTSWVTSLFRILPDESDGTLALSETKLNPPSAMADFTTLPANHSFLMNHPDTASLVAHFIQNGKFR